MYGNGRAKLLVFLAMLLPGLAVAGEPVTVEPGEGPDAALEVRSAFDDFMRVSQACQRVDGDTVVCICRERDTVRRMQEALMSALEAHPGREGRPLRYPEGDSTLQITIPAPRQQVHTVGSYCE